MKKAILLFFLVVLTAQLSAQEKSLVTVKNTAVNNGVLLVNIQEAGKPLELQCTQSAPHCTAPAPASYWMVRLPPNHGMYDCANVELYSQSENPENSDKVLGEYCLNEK